MQAISKTPMSQHVERERKLAVDFSRKLKILKEMEEKRKPPHGRESKTPMTKHVEDQGILAEDFNRNLKLSKEMDEKPPHGRDGKAPMSDTNLKISKETEEKPPHRGFSKSPMTERIKAEDKFAEDFNTNLKLSKEIEEKPPRGRDNKAATTEHINVEDKLAEDFNANLKISKAIEHKRPRSRNSKAPMSEHIEAEGKLADDSNTSSKIIEEKPTHGRESYIPPPEDEDFSFNCTHNVGPQVNADDIFQNGKIRPLPALRSRDIFRKAKETKSSSKAENIPVKKHDIHSLKNEELGRPYCEARGKAVEVSRKECIQKCNSTGLSKLRRDSGKMVRSHSDGKDAYRFWRNGGDRNQIPKSPLNPIREMETVRKMRRSKTMSAHERHYVKNRERSEGDKRKSFLPYKRGIVGFFTNANRFSFLHPF